MQSSNIVLSSELVPKVCDLGIGVSDQPDFKSGVSKSGTPRYMAPECVNDEPVTNLQAVDAYGFGWIAHDVTHLGISTSLQPSATSVASSGEPTGNAVSPIAHGDTTSGTEFTPWIGVLVRRALVNFAVEVGEHVPAPLAQLITACLVVDPEERPTLATARERLAAAALEAPHWR